MLYSQSPPLADDDAAHENSAREFGREREPRPEPQFGRRSVTESVYEPPRKSIGRRMFRAVMRFAILVGIGVGGTLGWQAYGDMAKQVLAERAPEYAWLLSYLPAARPPAAVAAATSPKLQLEPLAANLDFVRRSVEQMALKQEQIIRNIAALQAADEDIKQRMSSPPPAPAAAQPVAAIPQPKPAPPKPQAAPGAPAARPSASAAPVSILPR